MLSEGLCVMESKASDRERKVRQERSVWLTLKRAGESGTHLVNDMESATPLEQEEKN